VAHGKLFKKIKKGKKVRNGKLLSSLSCAEITTKCIKEYRRDASLHTCSAVLQRFDEC
jgi:hypothetical protein